MGRLASRTRCVHGDVFLNDDPLGYSLSGGSERVWVSPWFSVEELAGIGTLLGEAPELDSHQIKIKMAEAGDTYLTKSVKLFEISGDPEASFQWKSQPLTAEDVEAILGMIEHELDGGPVSVRRKLFVPGRFDALADRSPWVRESQVGSCFYCGGDAKIGHEPDRCPWYVARPDPLAILRDLAAMDAYEGGYNGCRFCSATEGHEDRCVWTLSVKWVDAESEADPLDNPA